MKKLYTGGKAKRIHPSPPAPTPSDLLSALPAALLALAAALSPQDQEVLAYLLSSAASSSSSAASAHRKPHRRLHNHPPDLSCGCFGCYKSFWARWDASPNRHVIHQIIDGFEETLESKELNRPQRGRGRRRRSGGRRNQAAELEEEVEEAGKGFQPLDGGHVADDDGGDDDDEEEEEEEEENGGKSSVRRFVSFIGERVWGVWN